MHAVVLVFHWNVGELRFQTLELRRRDDLGQDHVALDLEVADLLSERKTGKIRLVDVHEADFFSWIDHDLVSCILLEFHRP